MFLICPFSSYLLVNVFHPLVYFIPFIRYLTEFFLFSRASLPFRPTSLLLSVVVLPPLAFSAVPLLAAVLSVHQFLFQQHSFVNLTYFLQSGVSYSIILFPFFFYFIREVSGLVTWITRLRLLACHPNPSFSLANGEVIIVAPALPTAVINRFLSFEALCLTHKAQDFLMSERVSVCRSVSLFFNLNSIFTFYYFPF